MALTGSAGTGVHLMATFLIGFAVLLTIRLVAAVKGWF